MASQSKGLLPQEEVTLAAYNQVAAAWAAQYDIPSYWSVEMARFKEILPQGHILEIGSGGGRDAKLLIALGYQYTGSDISAGLLEVARQALPDQTFVQQSVYELDFDQQFDGFWASAMLLHIPRSRIVEALSRIRHTQRVGAIGFISLKDGLGDQIEVEVFGGQEVSRYFTFWKREEFEEVLPGAGFELVDYIYQPRNPGTRWHSFFVRAI